MCRGTDGTISGYNRVNDAMEFWKNDSGGDCLDSGGQNSRK